MTDTEHRCCSCAALGGAVLQWIARALDGEEVSDFGQSFGIVRRVMDLVRMVEAAEGLDR